VFKDSGRRRRPHQPRNLRFVLSGAGYGVDMAATAAAAVMLLGSTRYGLVIADWLLPDGDGIYIADRALALGSQTLIITGHLPDLPPGTGQRHRLLSKPAKPAASSSGSRHDGRATGQLLSRTGPK